MKKKLQLDFDWTKWTTARKDVQKLDKHTAIRMLFDVLLINEFEHALIELKNQNCVWGPLHTSVGQEAVAAGTIGALRPGDKASATHRAHHQFLAKVYNFFVDSAWSPLKSDVPAGGAEAIMRAMAEIMGLKTGYCGGRGGSMHLRCNEAGFLGSNAIVGGGIPLTNGAAFAELYRKTGNVIVAFFGDGAVNQGSYHEACNLAAIWDLPVIFLVENNEFAVATRNEEVTAVDDVSRRGAAYAMDGHIVDGSDPVSVYLCIKYVADAIRKGKGPSMVEAKCYRRYHHAGDQPGSSYNYRTKEEESRYFEKEAVNAYPTLLIETGVITRKESDRIFDRAHTAVQQAVKAVTQQEGDTRVVIPTLWPAKESVVAGMRSDGAEWQEISYIERAEFSEFTPMRYCDAIAAVTARWMEKDSETFVIGEEVANFGGGAYGATKGLPAGYPDRVRNTPISEAGFVGLGLGAAMCGMRPVVEIMFCDFSLVAADQLFNQVGKARHMYGNTTELPLVLRTRVCTGLGYGGQHSMDAAGLYSLFPGWRIVSPANAFDYIGLFNSAMHSRDPVLILEHQALYTQKFPVPVDELDYFIEFGKARVVAEGRQLTIITSASLVSRCEKLLPAFEQQGITPELIDLRTLDYPSVDYETVGESIKKTGAAMIVEEAKKSHSIGARIAHELTDRYFDFLDAPIATVTSKDVPPPVSRALELSALISDEEILSAVVKVSKRHWS
ncbi:MAG: MFS transporter [Chitinivibrionales bacterium]|nr:MFS transporter [Chitinivibrionales bacterium]